MAGGCRVGSGSRRRGLWVRTERAAKAFQALRGLATDGVAGPQTRGALRSLPIPLISVRQPRPWDVVGDPILVAGLATAFEATLQVRVRDANGNVFFERSLGACPPTEPGTAGKHRRGRRSLARRRPEWWSC
ncbi:MAG: Gmad2 immunoglobulin-like domain-containing protein [Actinomycetota bacterium]